MFDVETDCTQTPYKFSFGLARVLQNSEHNHEMFTSWAGTQNSPYTTAKVKTPLLEHPQACLDAQHPLQTTVGPDVRDKSQHGTDCLIQDWLSDWETDSLILSQTIQINAKQTRKRLQAICDPAQASRKNIACRHLSKNIDANNIYLCFTS